ncbi:hypothetical protein GS501_04820 [Saccharibacter sp. 17.LH.SD]|uniref:hypothetical protein n=1 Tax=Saccharibacter sp. 17.LH.SD TaxID=2689393 RepID=UPI00136F85FE|nr:hypothetical protein [Saccharibacter sp. 17.LH.SD]MXV44369.1 hypothetical protein [Saccharibacter sp. 17.LH.SD]
MSLYLIVSVFFVLITFLSALLIFMYRSGRNNARLSESKRHSSEMEQLAQATERMNAVQANGIRNTTQLLTLLKRGKF